MRALLVMGSNVVVSAPHAGHVQERIDALDFLAVCDLFLSETAERADVVLPVAQWAEEDGTMTNLEGRVILRRAAVDPPDGVRTDLEVLAGLAAAPRLRRAASRPIPRRSFEELRRASAGGRADYGGISYARIAARRRHVLALPGRGPARTRRGCSSSASPRRTAARASTPSTTSPPPEPPDDEYPLWFDHRPRPAPVPVRARRPGASRR